MAKKVLIIDDNSDDALNVSNMLRKAGMVCVYSGSTFDIQNLVYSEVPDLILLDVLMPEPGGYELCRMIKSDECAKNIPVIMYSVLNKNIDKFWAYRSGANAYIDKNSSEEDIVAVCNNIMEQMPVSLQVKTSLLNQKAKNLAVLPQGTNLKGDLIKEFNSIKEVDGDSNILSIKIFKTLYHYFKYDTALICFKDEADKAELFFDTVNSELSCEVVENIKNRINCKNCTENVLLEKDKTFKVEKLEDFTIKYEYEINSNSKIIGNFCIYAKNNLGSQELKLVGTIKDLVEHIMRLRYFKVCSKDNPNGTNPRKMYTRLDFDRILSYEYNWHKRNSSPMCLAFMEIDSLEGLEKQFGGEYCDIIIAKISNLLSRYLSDGDFVYRNQDDIFAILMTNSDIKRSKEALEYIVSQIEDPSLTNINEDGDVSVKIGALMLAEEHKSYYEYIDAVYDVLDEVRHAKEDIVIR